MFNIQFLMLNLPAGRQVFKENFENYFALRICSSVLMLLKSATQGTMIVALQLVK